mmetsp:Transcript_39122/g.63985  ORF Transcript_39122/g.63985 Transcript_39122/m.63985 type:complete len:215 (+) Transcript_39122:57-701(+)
MAAKHIVHLLCKRRIQFLHIGVHRQLLLFLHVQLEFHSKQIRLVHHMHNAENETVLGDQTRANLQIVARNTEQLSQLTLQLFHQSLILFNILLLVVGNLIHVTRDGADRHLGLQLNCAISIALQVQVITSGIDVEKTTVHPETHCGGHNAEQRRDERKDDRVADGVDSDCIQNLTRELRYIFQHNIRDNADFAHAAQFVLRQTALKPGGSKHVG